MINTSKLLPVQFSLSLGGAFIRLWERERGLVSEVAPCIVTDKETGELRLYGAEAAALEDRVPPHLEFRRLWWADKILDRENLRTLLQLILESESSGFKDRWQRPWRTQLLVPESMLPLHKRWLERTAREAGWWFPHMQPAYAGLLKQTSHAQLGNSKVQSFLDLGFSQTRFVAYVGNEVLLATSTEEFSLFRFCSVLADYLLDRHGIEVAPSSFYDQNWTRTRLAFHVKKQKPQEWSLELNEWKTQQQLFWEGMTEWIQKQTQSLSSTQRSEIDQREITLVGGGSSLWEGGLQKNLGLRIKRASDAPYAQMRSSF